MKDQIIKPPSKFERSVTSLVGHVIILSIGNEKDSLKGRIELVNRTLYSEKIKQAAIEQLRKQQVKLDEISNSK